MCLEGNTKIFMADGSYKPIKEIKIGDRVMTDSGESEIVKNIWVGIEKYMMCIELKNGSKIILTDIHPIKTISGIKKANEIDENHEILLAYKGSSKIASISCIEYNEKVYNLDISGNFMLAEGIAVGDFEVQNRK